MAVKSEFDEIASGYNNEIVANLGIFGKFRQSMLSYKSQYLQYLLPKIPESILDFGCGIGMNIPYLKEYFPNTQVYGCDISEESIRLASKHSGGCILNAIKSIEDLNIYENKIDCVFISTVLHHIPLVEHKKWLAKLYKILRKNGHMIIFEHNMKNPLTKRCVENTPMDKDAIMLDAEYCRNLVVSIFFGESASIDKSIIIPPTLLGYTYFFPWRNKIFTSIEHKLAWLPLGAQYYVMAKKHI